MDCRKSLFSALLLVFASLGCLGGKSVVSPDGSEPTDNGDLPKKPPQAATCVAFGDFKSREAADPHVPDAERGAMRAQARVAYEQALQIDSQCVPAYLGLAHLDSAQGEQARALEAYEKVLNVNPNLAVAWYEMGMCFTRLREWEQARQHLEKALSLERENRQYTTTLGFCLAHMGLYEDSLAVFLKVTGKAEAHYKVARMALHLKYDDVCLDFLHRALRENPDFAPAQQLLRQVEGQPPAASPPLHQADCVKQEEKAGAAGQGK
jgi:tetratricopeptide (TPR) repeat protein